MAKLTTKFKSLKKTTKVDFATYLGVIAVFIVVTVLQNGGMLNRKTIGLLVPICCYMSMAVSLNLTVGILGELSLGHAGFMSVGAFSGVIVSQSLLTAVPTRRCALPSPWSSARSSPPSWACSSVRRCCGSRATTSPS